MTTILIMIFSTIGSLFILVAAIGLVRMPDFYNRLSVTVKAATMGAGLILVAAALYFSEFSTSTKAIAIIFFLLLTAPVSGHMICRAAYYTGVKLWKHSVLDDLKGKYHPETQILTGLGKNDETNQEDYEDPELKSF